MSVGSSISRRDLVRTGGVLAGAAALGPAVPAFAQFAINSGNQGLPALAKSLKGRLLQPGDNAYTAAAWPNNARWSGVLPKPIAICASDEDVAACIRWARDNREPSAIRSGGHSYAGFSTTTGLLIDMKGMSAVKLDWQSRTATVQGGALNQDVADALHGSSFTIPGGRCPSVGVAGLVLGGGWGFSATHAGLTCDSLLSTELVDADARTITASGSERENLFWALRGGGGGNFGVCTSFTFRLHPVRQVTTFNILWPAGKQVQLMTALQYIQMWNPKRISSRSKVAPETGGAFPRREDLAVQTLGLFWGDARELREILQPAIAIADPLILELDQMSYWSARDHLVTEDPTGFYDIRSSYLAHTMNEDGLSAMLGWMTKWPGGSRRQTNMGILFAIGGAVGDKEPDATAYVHRDSSFLFEMETSWSPLDAPDVVDRQRAWLSDYFDDMQRFVLPRSYVNFPNRDLPNWQNAYYGDNLATLSAVKRDVDPDNVFRFEQSIPLPSG